MKLFELESTLEWRWGKVKGGVVARFFVGDYKVDVLFEKNEMVADWEVSFAVNGSYELTHTGSEMKIIATFIKILREFITKKKPASFFFSAKSGENREKLYSRFLAPYKKAGWETRIVNSGGETLFVAEDPKQAMPDW